MLALRLLPAACLLLVLPPAPRAAPLSPPPHPAPPRGLLVLRAACGARDPTAFHAQRLRPLVRTVDQAKIIDSYHLLEYKKTCEASWEGSIALAVLATLAQGGVVRVAGWPGSLACALLRRAGGEGAATAAVPRGCALPAARAAAVSAVAARLGWGRILVVAGGRGGRECAASLRAARTALQRNGAHVMYGPLSKGEETPHPHGVVMCAGGLPPRLQRPSAPLLLLLTEEDAPFMRNITLDVGNSPYERNVDSTEFALDSSVAVENKSYFVNLTRSYNESNAHGLSEKAKTRTDKNKIDQSKIDFHINNTGHINAKSIENNNMVRNDIQPRFLLTYTMPDPSKDFIEYILSYAISEALEDESNANEQIAKNEFYLLQNDYENNQWQEVAIVRTAAQPQGDDEDWTVTVEPVNATGDLWKREHAVRGTAHERAEGSALWAAVGVCVALVAGGAVWGARGAARRQRGRGRRGDVVLAVADFTFPADEARRVPDGMETMLSCWLQQLHEFGGPELRPPRPDLLTAAPPATPAPLPSNPSSTASNSRLALDRRTRYKGDAVQLKLLPLGEGVTELELRRRAVDVLLVLHSLRHENLNPFIGCLCESRPALVWDYCGRGSLEDVLRADDIRLDWTFRLSLLTDAVRGLRYLHASPLRVHGRLSSRNCAVDSRWVLRLTDHGQTDFYRAQGLTPPPRKSRDLLWTAPELLRAGAGAGEGAGARGTAAGDVFSFAIIMQEVIVRGEPYCMLALSPQEIVDKLCRPPPLIRPSVSMGAAPPEAVSVMRQCWAEAPELRPSTDALHDIFRLLHRGRKVNIVDSMFQMLEKYSNNLEELIKERTEQLDMEKKKTEQLLNRMLPRSVAEKLVLGLSVEPEEFEEVSIYFSDIVGFTALAARSTPVQVVALLNDLYTTFDAAIEQYKVYKVETIGDAYMVVGGLSAPAPGRCSEHAQSVATMALHLLHLAGRFRIRHLPACPLHLRIGLHSGPCCAGVVGLTMPRYCLFGDTVNTASRMESTGAAWRIQVSEATATRLEAAGGYRLRSRGHRYIKGKGLMHTYWLLGKEGFDKPLPTPPPLPSEDALLEHEAECEQEPPTGSPAPATAPLPAPRPPLPGDLPVPVTPHDKYAWHRSGAVSADSSPPAHPYSRYRCLGGGRALRRQWSLEGGEALSGGRPASPPAPLGPPHAPPVGPAAGRYRTRPQHADSSPTAGVQPSASFD